MREFKNPQNMGRIDDADGVGTVGNPVCGDMLRLFIKVKDDKIVDIKVETFGCVAAIATSSMTTQMAMGMTIEEAKTITRKMVADALDGLPPHKMHCSNLAAEALQKAIEDYESKTQGEKKAEKRP
ncbi:MAG: iron-sulfur cluster assembly scaffold protein [Candidatus Thorarchaeota archaeon]|nr:MAG: iron-sulfur cluster assembly scaffold protein [Candidatus Thorarchaeota archaeon]